MIELFNSRNNNVIYIIIDRLIKKRHYVFCIVDENDLTIEICVQILFHYVFRIYKLSSFIIFNQNDEFVNCV